MRGESPGMKWPPSAQRTPLDCANRRREGNDPHAAPCPQNKVGFANSRHPRESFAETNENTEKRDQRVNVFFFFTFVQNTKSFVGVAVAALAKGHDAAVLTCSC